jgi:hypothetical protein
MAISPRVIVKAYPSAIRSLTRQGAARHHFRQQGAQRRQRGCRRLRGGHGAHGPAGRGVQHPERNFLDRSARSIVEPASRDNLGIPVDEVVNVDRPLEPSVPRVRHHRLVPADPGAPDLMSVLSYGCTTGSGRTPRSATATRAADRGIRSTCSSDKKLKRTREGAFRSGGVQLIEALTEREQSGAPLYDRPEPAALLGRERLAVSAVSLPVTEPLLENRISAELVAPPTSRAATTPRSRR